MRNNIKIVILFLGIINSLFINAQNTFDKRYDGLYLRGAEKIYKTDKGYFLTGQIGDMSPTDPNEKYQPFYLSTDFNGNLTNLEKYDNNACQVRSYDYTKTYDGNYIGVGTSNTYGDTCGLAPIEDMYSQRFRYYMHKIDGEGNLIWQKNYGDTTYENRNHVGMGIIPSNTKGNYIVMTSYKTRMAVLAINSEGDTLWSKTNIGNSGFACIKIETVTDGYLCFTSNPSINKSELIKINEQGDIVWVKTIADIDFLNGTRTNDGNFAFVENRGNGVNKKTRITKINHQGDILWQAMYHDITASFTITELKDNNFIIAWQEIAKVDSLGNILWQKELIPKEQDMFYFYLDILEDDDGGLLFTGRTKDLRVLFTKTDCEGNLVWDHEACPTYSEDEEFAIYPNPIGNQITVSIPQSQSQEPLSFNLYDITGKKVKEIVFQDEKSINIETTNLSSGVYVYSILNDAKILQRGKVVKE